MKTYRFHFNTQYAADLRDAVNDRYKQSMDNEHKEKETNGRYPAWDRTCAAMDRLQDTLSYLNGIELGKETPFHAAFDFYDFINNAYIVIDCIKTLGKIFRVDETLISEIEESDSAFGSANGFTANDYRYFEYIRSLCSVHPLCTNHQKELLRGSKFHCCPFVAWKRGLILSGEKNADLVAVIYPSDSTKSTFYLSLYISQFEQYLTKWIDFIPKVIEAKNTYTDTEYEKLRDEPVKFLSEFDNDIVKYLRYLKIEYCKRFDYGNDYLFDDYIRFFSIKLSDSRNDGALKKYQNAIAYSLTFLRNQLQNMTFDGYENNGMLHPESWIETTLFDAIHSISPYNSAFSEYAYNLEKVYYLEADGHYDEYDKMFARNLLEGPKHLINQYVHFTNTEPDDEKIILVKLALYLEALSRKTLLNKNIPNSTEYRTQILTDAQYDALFEEENCNADNPNNSPEDLFELLKNMD